MKRIFVLMLALLLSGCGTDSGDGSSRSSSGRLVVQRVQPDGPIAEEGSVSFARIESEGGEVVIEEGFDAPEHGTEAGNYGYPSQLELALEPGSYTLVSYQRACDPSCDNLDPQDQQYTCQHPIEVGEGTRLIAEVRLHSSDCEIEVSVVSP